jgi:hypothetical protein
MTKDEKIPNVEIMKFVRKAYYIFINICFFTAGSSHIFDLILIGISVCEREDTGNIKVCSAGKKLFSEEAREVHGDKTFTRRGLVG